MSWRLLKSRTVVKRWNWMNVRKGFWFKTAWTALQRREIKINEGNRVTSIEMSKLW